MNIKDMPPKQLSAFVAEKVMGWNPHAECDGYVGPLDPSPDGRYCRKCGATDGWGGHFEHDAPRPPAYAESIEAAWAIVEKMLARQEQEHYFKHFEWDGPRYKPSHHYLTQEGYPLNTVCWYVVLSVNDYRQFVCADTAPRAICYAALQAVEAVERDGTVKEEV